MLALIAAALLLIFIIFSSSYFYYVRKSVIEQHKSTLTPRIQFIENIFNEYYHRYLSGEVSLTVAQQSALAIINQINAADDSYVFVFDDNYSLIASAYNDQMLNLNVEHTTDIRGEPLYQQLYYEALNQPNGGFSHYHYDPLSTNSGSARYASQQEKISYVQYFAPWGWVYGEGVYLKDVDNSIRLILRSN